MPGDAGSVTSAQCPGGPVLPLDLVEGELAGVPWGGAGFLSSGRVENGRPGAAPASGCRPRRETARSVQTASH